jgi:hypothetical protein
MEVPNALAYYDTYDMASNSAEKVSNGRLQALPKYYTRVEENGSAKHTNLL